MSTRKREPRHEVISVRLNEDRLNLLERYRTTLTDQLGRSVSIAEAAFLALDDRAPEIERSVSYYEQTQAPTAALDRIRKRWDAEHTLTAAQWDLLSEYVQIGTEEEQQQPPVLQPAIPSRASYLALLDAFEAIYSNRAESASRHAWLYFSKLGGRETRPALSADADAHDQELHDVIAHRRSLLQPDDTWVPPGQIGGCLRVAIKDEGVESGTLDRILAPHWSVLWGLAARGHWIRHDRRPIRAERMDDDLRHRLDLPTTLSAGEFRISFARSVGPEFATSIDFGTTRRFSVLIIRYPELIEFRTVLEHAGMQTWPGRYFQAARMTKPDAERTLWLRQQDVHIDLTAVEWRQLRDLFREAWADPQLQWRVQLLRQEYGEQG